jgi:hypothetical protein
LKAQQLAEAKKSGKNGNRAQLARLLVEGNYFTYAEMSKRTGRSITQCKYRYASLKRKGEWPIKWEQLA